MLKPIVKINLILLVAFTFSCGDDDGKKEYSFKDQHVQGELFEGSWEYADGSVNEGEHMLGVTLYPAHDEVLCSGTVNTQTMVGFPIPNEVGLYKLKSDPNFPGLIVLFTYFDSEGPITLYVEEGAVEILTITETEVTGRIDAHKDDNNHINGNFVVLFCNEAD
jgi:hypothetical protein